MQKKKFCSLLTAAVMLTGLGASQALSGEVIVEAKVAFEKTVDNFLVLYDSSSSMASKYADTDMTKIMAEQKVLAEANETLPPLDWNAGIFVFTPGDKPSLEGSFKTVLPMETYNKDTFGTAIAALPTTASGPTLVQAGLTEAGKIIEKLQGKTALFIFTDGTYTPDKRYELDPLALAKQLVRKYDTCIYAVSSATGQAERELVKAMTSLNECSMVIPFDKLLGHPGYTTGALYKVTEQAISVAVGGEVLFDFNKADIKPEYAKRLDATGKAMQENPKARLVLAGYTDGIGSEGYNMELSRQRAEAVRDYLLAKFKIDKNRITLHWYGKTDPVASNQTPEGRAQNRRVVGILSGM
jgi:OOP family OmpA-OmpF porin